jgi:protein-tyrosine phosphatase
MAEGLLRQELANRGIGGVIVESAGVSGWDDSPATPEAVQAMAEYEIDISAHLGRRLSDGMVRAADLVLAMAAEHRESLGQIAPGAASRTFTLKELVHLLDQSGDEANGGTPAERIRRAAERAAALRASGSGQDLTDEDVADPLGLSLAAFQAAAWELEHLIRRLVDQIFEGGREPEPEPVEAERAPAPADVARDPWERLGAEPAAGGRSGERVSWAQDGSA